MAAQEQVLSHPVNAGTGHGCDLTRSDQRDQMGRADVHQLCRLRRGEPIGRRIESHLVASKQVAVASSTPGPTTGCRRPLLDNENADG